MHSEAEGEEEIEAASVSMDEDRKHKALLNDTEIKETITPKT